MLVAKFVTWKIGEVDGPVSVHEDALPVRSNGLFWKSTIKPVTLFALLNVLRSDGSRGFPWAMATEPALMTVPAVSETTPVPTFIVPGVMKVPAVTVKLNVVPVTVLAKRTLVPALSVVIEPIVTAPV